MVKKTKPQKKGINKAAKPLKKPAKAVKAAKKSGKTAKKTATKIKSWVGSVGMAICKAVNNSENKKEGIFVQSPPLVFRNQLSAVRILVH